MNYEDFDQLAALDVFWLLDELEWGAIEDAIAQSPELVDELTQLQGSAAAIGYSAPTVPMAPDLKERLFQRIADTEVKDNSVAALTQQAANVSWKPYSVAGVMVGTLYINRTRREIACFVRAEAGVQFPYHLHAGNEEIVVLEGDLVIDDKVYTSGESILSTSGSAHKPKTSNGCLLFLLTSLDDQILH
jgi:hypothetical protein